MTNQEDFEKEISLVRIVDVKFDMLDRFGQKYGSFALSSFIILFSRGN